PFKRPRKIPKGRGKKGWRVIEGHHEDGPVGRAHHAANEVLAPLIPRLSPAAYGVRGRKLEDALTPHMGKRYFAKVDIVDFFPSTHPRLVRHALRHELGEEDPRLIRLFMSQRHLPQGPKASPAVSNLLLVGFDRAVLRATASGVGYTRYADDLF